MPNRPELVARYGYDVRYASHALRLAYQGREIARTVGAWCIRAHQQHWGWE